MPEGQFTGAKGSYVYQTDDGQAYLISRDVTLALGELSGLEAATDASTQLSATPKRFRPRGVYWQGALNGRIVRKFIICGTSIVDLYALNTSQPLTIDGVVGSTTGKKGESVSFVRINTVTPPPTP